MRSYIFLSIFLIITCSLIANFVQAQDIKTVLNSRLEEYKKSVPAERVFLINDRDIYAPGDIIWINALIYDISSPNLSRRSSKVNISLYGSNNIKILSKEFELELGRANCFIRIPESLEDGLYYLTGSTTLSDEFSLYQKKLVIRDIIVPPYVIEVSFPDLIYLPGDDIQLNISFKDFNNEPKKNVDYQVSLFDGRKQVMQYSGKIKKGGIVKQTIKIPSAINSGLLSYKINAEVKDIKAEQAGVIPVMTKKVFVDFSPTSGKIIEGMDNTVNFYVYNAYGLPLQIQGELQANGENTTLVETNKNGMGSFIINPKTDQEYSLKLIAPIVLEESYSLPEVVGQGIKLDVISILDDKIQLGIESSYTDPTSFVLVGTSENDIFCIAEQSIQKELNLEINILNVKGKLARFTLLNGKAEIEAELIVNFKSDDDNALKTDIVNNTPVIKSKVDVGVSNAELNGSYILASVNKPWLLDQLNNMPIEFIDLPYDYSFSSTFCQPALTQLVADGELMDEYMKFYVPNVFSWNKILDADRELILPKVDELVYSNQMNYYEILAQNSTLKRTEQILQSNLTASDYFAENNQKYISELYKRKFEKVPPYKTLLENGTPLLEVIRAIRPYNLHGNKIVFYGGTNSLQAQDGALIVIDGVRMGTDVSALESINPFEVDKISISTKSADIHRYTGLNSVGLIEIETKQGERIETKKEQFPEDLEFKSPEYYKQIIGDDDYRSTLMWDVKYDIPAGIDFQSLYHHSDFISPVKLKLYFIPDSGTPIYREFEYLIK